MAKLNYQTVLASTGMLALPSTVGKAVPGPLRARRDFRYDGDTRGVVRGVAVLKTSAAAPEVPFANARIWLHRLVDGGKVWEGVSDAMGAYVATSLIVGEQYIATGIDANGDHKSVGAGPVTAVLEV